MHALEGAECWFKDSITLPVEHGFASAWIDPTFRECCAPGCIFAQYAHADDCTGCIGAEVYHSAGRVWLEVRVHPVPLHFMQVTVSIAGLRREFADKRLPLCTRGQYLSNNAFYAQAHAA